MSDDSKQKGVYKIRSDCEATIKTLSTYKTISAEMDIQLSDFALGQLKGATDQLKRIRQMTIDIIAEREKEDDKDNQGELNGN